MQLHAESPNKTKSCNQGHDLAREGNEIVRALLPLYSRAPPGGGP
jgi:hypothetical protein